MDYRERERDWDYRSGHATPHLPPPSPSPVSAWPPNEPPPSHSAWPDTRDPRRAPIINSSPSASADWDRRKTWVDDRAVDPHHIPPHHRGSWERETPRVHSHSDPIDDTRWRQDPRADPYPNSRGVPPPRHEPIAVYGARGSQPLTPSPAFDPAFPPPPPRTGYPPAAWSGPPTSPSVHHSVYERDRPASRLSQPLGPPPEPLSRRPHARTSSGSFPIESGFQVAPPTAPRADRAPHSDYDRRGDREFMREIKREELDEPGEWKPVVPPVSKHSTGSSVVYGGERGILPPLGPAHRPYSRNGYLGSPRTSTPSSYTQEPPSSRYQLPPLGAQSQDHSDPGLRLHDNEPSPFASPSRRSSFSRPAPPPRSLTPDAPPELQYRRTMEPGIGQSPSRLYPGAASNHDARDIPQVGHNQEQHRDEVMRPLPAIEHGESGRQNGLPDAMEVDTAASVTTPRMGSRPENGPSPDFHRVVDSVPMDTREDNIRPPSERAASPEEPVTRASGEEEEEEAPRRTRPTRRVAKRRPGRPPRRAAEDMDVDDDPARQFLAIGLPSAQEAEAITQYMGSNKRFEPDSGFDLVEEVLSQNRHLAETMTSRQPSTADQLVGEIARSTQTEALIRDYCDGTRDVIVAQVKRGYEDVNAKVKKLRNQYIALNREWEARCTELDREKQLNSEKLAPKTPIPPTPSVDTPSFSANSFFTSGRTTRRTTGGLGNLMAADAVRSDLEFEQVMASLGNEDLVDPNILSIRNAASIPDMLSVQPRAQPLLDVVYDDTNGVVEYPEQFYDVSASLGDWTDEEKEIFMEQFAVNGKQFGKIADHLPNKTAEQCVLFYYISKKSLVDYGEVLNSKKYARGRRKVLARRNIAAHLGKQKGNALLTDIRTTQGAATPADSPSGSPKNTDIELGAPVPRRRGRPPANGGLAGTRPVRSAARGRRGASPESDIETPANAASGEEGSSSENDGEAPSATEGGRRSNKPRRSATERKDIPTPLPSTPADKKKESKKGRPSSHWSTLERKVYLEQLALHGKSWYHIAQEVKTKTPAQCRNFYKANEKDMELDKIVEAWEAQNRESESEPERDKASLSASSATPEEPAAKVSGIEALRSIQTANAAHSKPADAHPSNGIHSLPKRPDSTSTAPAASSQSGKDNVAQSRVFPYTTPSGFDPRLSLGQPSNTAYIQQMSPYGNGAGQGQWAQRPPAGIPPTYAQPAAFLPTPSSNVYSAATTANRIPSGNLVPPPVAPSTANSNSHSLPPKPSFATFDSAQSAQGTPSRVPTNSGMPQRPTNGSGANGTSTASTLVPPQLSSASLPAKPVTHSGNGMGPAQSSPTFQDSPYGSKQVGSTPTQLQALPPFGSKPNPVSMVRPSSSQSSAPPVAIDSSNSMDGLD